MWGNSPVAIGVRFTPPTTPSGIVRFRGSAGGSNCDVSINGADISCLIRPLHGATRYNVEGVSCDEVGLCSSPVSRSSVTIPDRELKYYFSRYNFYKLNRVFNETPRHRLQRS